MVEFRAAVAVPAICRAKAGAVNKHAFHNRCLPCAVRGVTSAGAFAHSQLGMKWGLIVIAALNKISCERCNMVLYSS
jgi:hypothetical protein